MGTKRFFDVEVSRTATIRVELDEHDSLVDAGIWRCDPEDNIRDWAEELAGYAFYGERRTDAVIQDDDYHVESVREVKDSTP